MILPGFEKESNLEDYCLNKSSSSALIRCQFFEKLLKTGLFFLETVHKHLNFLKNRQKRPHLAGFSDKNSHLAVFRREIRFMAISPNLDYLP